MAMVTSGKPRRDGTPLSHSAEAPAPIRAPSNISPLMPATGSMLAKRPSGIDLQYRPKDPKLLPSLLQVAQNPLSQMLRKSRNLSQLGYGRRFHAGQASETL